MLVNMRCILAIRLVLVAAAETAAMSVSAIMTTTIRSEISAAGVAAEKSKIRLEFFGADFTNRSRLLEKNLLVVAVVHIEFSVCDARRNDKPNRCDCDERVYDNGKNAACASENRHEIEVKETE